MVANQAHETFNDMKYISVWYKLEDKFLTAGSGNSTEIQRNKDNEMLQQYTAWYNLQNSPNDDII